MRPILAAFLAYLAALVLVPCLPATAGVSYYLEKPADSLAVDFTKTNFPVHADGVTDDAPALQAAIDAAAARGARIVLVPAGTYRLAKTVSVWSGTRLIGYGKTRPLFLLAENTPGYQTLSADAIGIGQYMLQFPSNKPAAGQPIADGNPGTLFSGLANIDFEIQDGNAAAVAVRFHVAQQAEIVHCDFHIGSALAAVDRMGNIVEDCSFSGGDWGIVARLTAAGWQSTVLDCQFEGQRKGAISTRDGGMTVIRTRFRGMPVGVTIPGPENQYVDPVRNDWIYLKDCRFEDVSDTAVAGRRYYDPRTAVNAENIVLSNTPAMLTFPQFDVGSSRIAADQLRLAAPGKLWIVHQLSHGLRITIDQTAQPVMNRVLDTRYDVAPLEVLPPLPDSDIPTLPPQAAWVNIRDMGAKGDGQANDTAAFRKAIAEHQTIYVPTGRYLLTDTLELKPDTALIGLHSASTLFVLANATPGFNNPAQLKPMILAPIGGTNIFTGIGFTQNSARNLGSVGIKWQAGERSYVNDVSFGYAFGAGGKGAAAGDSLWVADGGGGTFKGIWSHDESEHSGFHVSNTKTPGHVYMLSVEHHKEMELLLGGVEHWTFYAPQTEENAGSEEAHSWDIENCGNIQLVNVFMYHIARTPRAFPYAVRLKDSQDIVIRAMHNFSSGPFPYDNTVWNVNTDTYVAAPEFGYLAIK